MPLIAANLAAKPASMIDASGDWSTVDGMPGPSSPAVSAVASAWPALGGGAAAIIGLPIMSFFISSALKRLTQFNMLGQDCVGGALNNAGVCAVEIVIDS